MAKTQTRFWPLTVGKGQLIAVIGPSGCGKSTLMKVVTGLVLPSRGIVKVAGEAVTGPVKNVGMAFQNATLLPWRTIMDNVLLPFEIIRPHRHKLRAERRYYVELVQRLLSTVGLAGFSEKYSWQLSGGMRWMRRTDRPHPFVSPRTCRSFMTNRPRTRV